MSQPRLFALLLAFITLVVFLPVGQFSFVNYDDTDYVTENAFVKGGLTAANIHWAFTAFHAGNWHPLSWLSHMIDCSLFGPNAGAHHFMSVLFHAANVALLFTLLWRWTARLWPSALVAALFAWHPLHVESVAWISERKDVLTTFFALLSLLNYTRFVQEKSRRHFWLALLCFALGLLAKPMLVTLPCVLLLLDFWPLKRVENYQLKVADSRQENFQLSTFNLQLFTEKLPFFALTAVSCIVTFLAQRQGEAVVSLAKVSLSYRLQNAPVAAVTYLEKFFLPTDLCAIYPMPQKIAALQVFAAVAVLILITVIAWRWRLTEPYFLVGWLWFLGTLVPVIGLVQVGGQALADRYTYIPSIGFFIAFVFLAADFAAKIQTPKFISLGFAGLISLGCIIGTEFQLPYWRDSETLFRRALAVTKDNDIALVNLGVALDVQGRFEEALAIYQSAAKLESGRHQVHNNLGNILDKLGRHAESLVEYREALRLRPGDALLQNAVGIELAALGQFEAALTAFAEAMQFDPKLGGPHLETGKTLFKLGRDAEGVTAFRAALRLDPNNYQTLATIARHLAANENAAARDGQNALALALKANELSGRVQPMVFDILGMTLASNGDFTNAIICAQNALDLATANQMKNTDQISQRLVLYKKQQPWRESFRATTTPGKN
jgi:tetratricopeptide (TPR) repeat protein